MKKIVVILALSLLSSLTMWSATITVFRSEGKKFERVAGTVSLNPRSVFVVNHVPEEYGLRHYGNHKYEAGIIYMAGMRNASYMGAIHNITDHDISVKCYFYSGNDVVDSIIVNVQARTCKKFGLGNKNINSNNITKVVFIR
ncbi:MAG: hypothetical protein K2K79_07170 [Paramuribaculum sp.]|nr:hypothetical protein [Paramuribaculum sp.]